MKLIKQMAAIVFVVAVFGLFNYSVYTVFTRRLANNTGSSTNAQMINVADFLPFEEGSDLPKINSDFKISGDLPVLDGAAALVPVYRAIIDNVYPVGCVTYEGGHFSDDNFYGENFAKDSRMQYKNSVRGFTAVVDGDTDIFFCTYPSRRQLQYAQDNGAELVYVPVGLEAFVFFVNSHNPVDNLSSQQIKMIYSGRHTNWSQVGGPDRVINPVMRVAGSGSQSTFERFMGDIKPGRKSVFAVVGGSIGFSFRWYLEGMVANDDVKMLSLDGVYPSPDNIRSGTYPLITQFYAIYRADNNNENIPKLIDWLLSSEGQGLIGRCGYISVN